MISFLNLVLVLAVTAFSAVWFLRRRHLPPGPWGLPVVGCLFRLGEKPHLTYANWAKQYGDVFSVQLGTELVVVLNTHRAIKDAFVKKSAKFSSRPLGGLTPVCKHKGIVHAPSPEWQTLRKRSVKILQELGMARQSTEQRINDESEYLSTALQNLNGAPTVLSKMIMKAVSNIICGLLFGRRFDYGDEDIDKLVTFTRQFSIDAQAAKIYNYFPALWHVPLRIKHNLQFSLSKLIGYIKDEVEERLRVARRDSPPNSYIDAYLSLKENAQKLEDPENLYQSVAQLFGGGFDTVSSVMLWAILYLCLDQDIQQKCFREIRDNIGLETVPSLSDRPKLPYLEAVILEVQRKSTILPLALPHATSEEAHIYGYTIPKGATVFANLWAVHMSEENWQNPDKFDPQRFLDEEGKVVNRDKIIPFSLGARDCLGSELAKMELFLFLSKLIKEFHFKLPEDDATPSTEGSFGTVTPPEKYKVVALKRDV